MLEAFFQNSNVWVAISFITVIAIIVKFAGKFIIGSIDNKITEIKREITEAENLRVEAQEMLAQYQRKQRDAEKEASAILDNAKTHADNIRKKAEADIEIVMARKEEQLAERLKRIEENAVAEIQDQAAEIALAATTQIILEKTDAKTDAKLQSKTIKNLASALN